jgi:UDP-N-acetylglucosamine--N-acetylmuramyl-(pentapeptide) pyrophosphoryl-undecaprenol N-acetylglucosamine transferase
MSGATNNEQFLNAKYLSENNAAILIKDSDISNELVPILSECLRNETKRNDLSKNLIKIARPNATEQIADYIYNHIK